MKVLLIIFIVMWAIFTIFGTLKINNIPINNIIWKIIGGFICSLMIMILFGLPIMGIIYFIGLF